MKLQKIIVTDPCYRQDSISDDCIIKVDVRAGNWEFSIEESSEESSKTRLVACCTDIDVNPGYRSYTQLGKACVDSGQIGIFDLNLYPKGETGEFDDKKSFYGRACDITLSDNGHGQMEEGFVTRTVYGDGVYNVNAATFDGEIVCIKIDLE